MVGGCARCLRADRAGVGARHRLQFSGVNDYYSCVGGANNSAGDPSCFGTSNFLQAAGAHNPRILQFGMKLIF
jgi:hypothetical protein